MRVVHIPCGAFVNASEERAFKDIDGHLRRVDSNLTAFCTHQSQLCQF